MKAFLAYLSIICLSYNVISGSLTLLFYRHYLIFKTILGRTLLHILLLASIHSLFLLFKIHVFTEVNTAYTMPFSLLYGPLMYIGFQKSSYQKYSLPYKFLYFSPFLVVLFYLLCCFIFPNFYFFSEKKFKTFNYFITFLAFLFYGIQLIVVFILSVKNERNSDLSKDFLFLMSGILISSSLVNMGLLFLNSTKSMSNSPVLLHVLLTLGVILIVMKLTKLQNELLKNEQSVSLFDAVCEVKDAEKKRKYAKSKLDDQQLLSYKSAIESIENDFFYNPELNLEMLVDRLRIKKYHVTQTFSLTLNTSFSNYTNLRRIEYAMELLKENPDKKATEIAFVVGFNSAKNFNKVFLSIVGETPTKFRKRINDSFLESSNQ